MKIPKKYDIESCTPRAQLDIGVNGAKVPVTISEAVMRTGDFSYYLWALNQDPLNELLGWVGFRYGRLACAKPTASYVELRMLKVDPPYFRSGVATALLEHSKALAGEKSKTILLEPKRPGELMAQELRDQYYPLSTGQLRDMYKRHGFRELEAEEFTELYNAEIDDYCTTHLWMEGINSSTRRFGRRRYTMSLEQRAEMDAIPLEEKVAIMGKRVSPGALESHLKMYRAKIEALLIEQ